MRRIDRSPVDSPHKGQWCGYLMFSLICAWTHGLANNRDAGDLRRHRACYDVTALCRASSFDSSCPILPAVPSYGSRAHPNPWSHSPDVARHRKESGSPYDHAALGSYGNRSAHRAWACRGYCAGTTGHQRAWGLGRMVRLLQGPCPAQSLALGCCRRFAPPRLHRSILKIKTNWDDIIHVSSDLESDII